MNHIRCNATSGILMMVNTLFPPQLVPSNVIFALIISILNKQTKKQAKCSKCVRIKFSMFGILVILFPAIF